VFAGLRQCHWDVRQWQRSGACRGQELDRGQVRAHWSVALKVLTGAFFHDSTAGEAAAFSRFQPASASAAVAARHLEVYYDTDIGALLPVIRARAVVLHREGDRSATFEPGRNVATLIAGATLIPLPGSNHLAWPGGRDGRKLLTGPALPGPSGQVLAATRAVRLSVPGPVLARAVEGVP
jgi:hypothetical protein